MFDEAAEQSFGREPSAGADPGDTSFPALAEARRRDGRAEEAERIARRGLDREPACVEGRLVLGLALLDQGRTEAGRSELETLLGELLAGHGLDRVAPAATLDAELDRALDHAETDREALIDPDRVAAEALARVEAPEGPAHPLREAIGEGGTFATRTMAELLEQQGDGRSAARIRAVLEPQQDDPDAGNRQHLIAELERWLQNLRSSAGGPT